MNESADAMQSGHQELIMVRMNNGLRAKVRALGYDPERVFWGVRISGDMHGARVQNPITGDQRYHQGPFFSERFGDQIAIVKWG